MNTVICILAIVALAAAAEKDTRSNSNDLMNMVEQVRDEMPCGFPRLGIGSLAPLYVSHKTVNVDTSTLQLLGSAQNFTVNGLNLFEVLQMRHSAVRRKITFEILFENIEVDTWYDLASDLHADGFTLKLIGSGKANFALKGLRLTGTIKYGVSVLNLRVTLKELRIVPNLESVESNIQGVFGSGKINEKWNTALVKRVPTLVNTFAESIAKQIQDILMPRINKFLHQYTLSDILGGVGSNAAGGEKVKCGEVVNAEDLSS